MPVVITPTPWKVGRNYDRKVTSTRELLEVEARIWSGAPESDPRRPWRRSNKSTTKEDRRVIQTSFKDLDTKSSLIPYQSGFVKGIIRAFNQDLHLVLRPDDVWIAILTQFSFFVRGNTEDLRSQFVTHEGKGELIVDVSPFSLNHLNMGKFAQKMASLIDANNTRDPGIKEWAVPDFTTTTDEDRSVASIILMGTMEKFYEYDMRGGCGFPSVTLLGQKDDWVKLRSRLDRLPKYHHDTAAWARLLIPVIHHMIDSFDHPYAASTKDFWMHVCYEAGGAYMTSEPNTLSGWITAFCMWHEDGEHIHKLSDEELQPQNYDGADCPIEQRKRLVLDGVRFPLIDPMELPKSIVMAPVIVQDHESQTEFKTTIIAGCVGMQLSENGSRVQPRPGWLMLEDSSKPLMRVRPFISVGTAASLASDSDSTDSIESLKSAFLAHTPESTPISSPSDERRSSLQVTKTKHISPAKRQTSCFGRETTVGQSPLALGQLRKRWRKFKASLRRTYPHHDPIKDKQLSFHSCASCVKGTLHPEVDDVEHGILWTVHFDYSAVIIGASNGCDLFQSFLKIMNGDKGARDRLICILSIEKQRAGLYWVCRDAGEPMDYAINRLGPWASMAGREDWLYIAHDYFVAVKPDSVQRNMITGRPYNTREDLNSTFAWIQEQFAYCKECHGDSCVNTMSPRSNPLRLLDVYAGSPSAPKTRYYYPTKCEKVQYAALTYCWGLTAHIVRASRASIALWTKEIPFSTLPETLQDAIIVTRALGIQYLWIDALCIEQDNEQEKSQEIRRMADIYLNAAITISASWGQNCNDGILKTVTQTLKYFNLPIPSAGPPKADNSVLLQEQMTNQKLPIHTRGWTLQERLLSQRIVEFTDRQVIWKCGKGRAVDGGFDEREFGSSRSVDAVLDPGSTVWESRKIHSDPEYPPALKSHITALRYWRRVYIDYSKRRLTNTSDKLVAVSAIATFLARIFNKRDEYLAGIWRSAWPSELLWSARDEGDISPNDSSSAAMFKSWRPMAMYPINVPATSATRRRKSPSNQHQSENASTPDNYQAPSWSWASVNRYIEPADFSCEHADVTAKLIDASINLTVAESLYGAVTGGHITLTAYYERLEWNRPHHNGEVNTLIWKEFAFLNPWRGWLGPERTTSGDRQLSYKVYLDVRPDSKSTPAGIEGHDWVELYGVELVRKRGGCTSYGLLLYKRAQDNCYVRVGKYEYQVNLGLNWQRGQGQDKDEQEGQSWCIENSAEFLIV